MCRVWHSTATMDTKDLVSVVVLVVDCIVHTRGAQYILCPPENSQDERLRHRFGS